MISRQLYLYLISNVSYWQVVWKGTTKLGCAIQKRERATYIVARYSPPGNVIGTGTFAKNVGRKLPVCWYYID